MIRSRVSVDVGGLCHLALDETARLRSPLLAGRHGIEPWLVCSQPNYLVEGLLCVTALLFLQKVLASVDEGGAQSTGFLGFLLLKQPCLHKPLCEAQRHVRYRI